MSGYAKEMECCENCNNSQNWVSIYLCTVYVIYVLILSFHLCISVQAELRSSKRCLGNLSLYFSLICTPNYRLVPISEASVVIAISSVHRKDSLEAVQYCIDTLKATVPIWKKVPKVQFIGK